MGATQARCGGRSWRSAVFCCQGFGGHRPTATENLRSNDARAGKSKTPVREESGPGFLWLLLGGNYFRARRRAAGPVPPTGRRTVWAPAAPVVASLLPPPATCWRHPCGVARLGRRARTPTGSGRGREPASEGSGGSTVVLKRPDFGRSPWASTAGDNAVGGRLRA